MGVVPGREKEQVGVEVANEWKDLSPHGFDDRIAACSGGKRDVACGAGSGAASAFVCGARAGKDASVLMDRAVEDIVAVAKDVLCAVAVMDIPIDDRDAGAAPGFGVGGGDRDGIEQAKAHGGGAGGMMPGGTGEDERSRCRSGEDRIGSMETGTGGEPDGL